jgi:hypothetical protein
MSILLRRNIQRQNASRLATSNPLDETIVPTITEHCFQRLWIALGEALDYKTTNLSIDSGRAGMHALRCDDQLADFSILAEEVSNLPIRDHSFNVSLFLCVHETVHGKMYLQPLTRGPAGPQSRWRKLLGTGRTNTALPCASQRLAR